MRRKADPIAAFAAIHDDYRSRALDGYRTDFEAFELWCMAKKRRPLPATLTTVAHFLEDQATRETAIVVKRQLCAIVFVHARAKHSLPTWGAKIQRSIRFAEVNDAFNITFGGDALGRDI